VRADLLPGVLADGGLAVTGGLHYRRRLAPAGQGRPQRRIAVIAVRAVPGRSAGDRRILELQHGGVDLWWSGAARRDLADRADRRPLVAELLPDLHRAAQPSRTARNPAAPPQRDPTRIGSRDGVVSP